MGSYMHLAPDRLKTLCLVHIHGHWAFDALYFGHIKGPFALDASKDILSWMCPRAGAFNTLCLGYIQGYFALNVLGLRCIRGFFVLDVANGPIHAFQGAIPWMHARAVGLEFMLPCMHPKILCLRCIKGHWNFDVHCFGHIQGHFTLDTCIYTLFQAF